MKRTVRSRSIVVPSTRSPALRPWLAAALAATALGTALPAAADADLARAKNCMACHAADRKLIGPSFKDIAAKYGGDAKAAERLAKKVREGGVGAWGQIPMPGNPQVSEAESLKLVRWILGQK